MRVLRGDVVDDDKLLTRVGCQLAILVSSTPIKREDCTAHHSQFFPGAPSPQKVPALVRPVQPVGVLCQPDRWGQRTYKALCICEGFFAPHV